MKCFTFLFVYLLFMYTSNAQTSKELSEQYENAMTYNLYEDALSTGEKLAQKIANNKALNPNVMSAYDLIIEDAVGEIKEILEKELQQLRAMELEAKKAKGWFNSTLCSNSLEMGIAWDSINKASHNIKNRDTPKPSSLH